MFQEVNHFKAEKLRWNWSERNNGMYSEIYHKIQNMKLINSKDFKYFGVWIRYNKSAIRKLNTEQVSVGVLLPNTVRQYKTKMIT